MIANDFPLIRLIRGNRYKEKLRVLIMARERHYGPWLARVCAPEVNGIGQANVIVSARLKAGEVNVLVGRQAGYRAAPFQ